HIGGLLTGAILAFFVPYIAPGSVRVSRVGLAILVGCIALIAYSFMRAYQTSGRGGPISGKMVPRELDRLKAELQTDVRYRIQFHQLRTY
ncbi:MAG: hypothetical protein J2P31_10950, partial [Blastocatellia bacterium]|nr:hypothetical protein [Blastocatellia bacterium]